MPPDTVHVARKHWFIFFSEIVKVFALLVIPLIAVAAVAYGLSRLDLPADMRAVIDAHEGPFLIFLGSWWLLILWMRLFYAWMDHDLDTWIITSSQVIDTEQLSLFNHKTTTVALENIQNVSVHVNGAIETFLGFGTIDLETAGEHGNLEIRTVPEPERVKEIILAEKARAERDIEAGPDA